MVLNFIAGTYIVYKWYYGVTLNLINRSDVLNDFLPFSTLTFLALFNYIHPTSVMMFRENNSVNHQGLGSSFISWMTEATKRR